MPVGRRLQQTLFLGYAASWPGSTVWAMEGFRQSFAARIRRDVTLDTDWCEGASTSGTAVIRTYVLPKQSLQTLISTFCNVASQRVGRHLRPGDTPVPPVASTDLRRYSMPRLHLAYPPFFDSTARHTRLQVFCSTAIATWTTS
jgi:hypothetical protein